MQHYVDSVTAFNGDKVTNASITVTTLAGNTAPIYLDVNGTMPVTSVSTNTNGEFDFYIESGRYNINVSGPGIVSYSLLDVFIFYPNAIGLLPVNIGGTGVSTSTGTGSVVLNISPTLVTPVLGTPASGNLANCTGIPAGGITGTLPVANGGTGVTTFTAANNALYSTSAGALTAGTLPVAAGGTGLTSLTLNRIPYGNNGSAYSSSANLTFDGTILGLNSTAAILIPKGTTGQQPAGVSGYLRFNTTTTKFEGYDGTLWGAIGGGGGATGGGSDQVFVENAMIITTNYTLSAGKSAMSTGPITINSGIIITVPTGSRWVVL